MRRSRIDGNLTRAVLLLVAGLAPLPVRAGSPAGFRYDRLFETQTVWGLSLAPGAMAMGPASTTAPLTVSLAQTFRFPRYSHFGLELAFVAPGGLSATLLVDAVRTRYVRVHLIDPGVVWNLLGPVSVARAPRSADIVLGAGVDVFVTRGLTLTASWRMYFPEPVATISRYGDFARPIYAEAAKGGQLCFGLAHAW